LHTAHAHKAHQLAALLVAIDGAELTEADGEVAVAALAVRKELLIPVLCGIFLIENLSVMMQVAYFKYTKKKYGEGRRIFLMSPLHHHYQKKNIHESKIVTRFWIVGILLAILTLATLKLQ